VREERVRDFLSKTSVHKISHGGAGAGASSQARGSWKENLFSAAHSGDVDAFEGVLAGGAPVDTPIGAGASSAAVAGRELLADVGHGAHKWDTPLIVAARQGNVNIVNVCLRAGAKNDPFGEGTTALHAAVAARQVDAAEVLLQAAARAGAAASICDILDTSGSSPMHVAAKLLGGADAEAGGAKAGMRLLELLVGHGGSLQVRDAKQRTCLHLAAEAKHAEALELLLEFDDSLINLVDLSGNAALHIAVVQNNIACARVLLQSAANPYLKSLQHGKNALDLAISRGFTNLGVLLLEYKSYVDENGHAEFIDPDAVVVVSAAAAGNSDSDGISLAKSGKVVGKKLWDTPAIAAPVLTAVAGYGEGEEGGLAAEETFTLQGQRWQVFLLRDAGAAAVPYFVDEAGEASWDDPRDFLAAEEEEAGEASWDDPRDFLAAEEEEEKEEEQEEEEEGEEEEEEEEEEEAQQKPAQTDTRPLENADFTADGSWLHGALPEVVPVYREYPHVPPAEGGQGEPAQPEYFLRKRRHSDSAAYFAAVEASRSHLNRTLPSRAVPETLEAAQAMVASSIAQWEQRTAFQYFIWEVPRHSAALAQGEETLVGAVAMFNRRAPHSLEVGFWVAESRCRQALATRASLALMLVAFDTFSLPQKSRGSLTGQAEVPGSSRSSDLRTIELYHDKIMERQSGGVARKIGFLREEEQRYEPAATRAPVSGLLVRWAYPADRRARLESLKLGKSK